MDYGLFNVTAVRMMDVMLIMAGSWFVSQVK
jgi:hypothetical protein